MRFEIITPNPKDVYMTAEFQTMNDDDKTIALGPNTVKFLDPKSLLRMYAGFCKATPDTDYARATEAFKEMCYDEIQRRLLIEHLSRGSGRPG